MYIYRLTKYKDLVSKTAFTVAVLIASLTLIGCESSDDDDEPGTVDTGTTDTGTTDTGTTDTGTTDTGTTDTGIVGGLMPDNDPAEIFGDWATGCLPENDTNGQLERHAKYIYSINQNTWTEFVERYAVDDPTCSVWLGTAVYTYQIEILDTATPATLDGSFVGNAINVNIIDTTEDGMGEVDIENLGSGLAIWLLIDERLYSRLDFAGSQPTALLEKYALSRN